MIITVANQKGGVGKTTTTMNLGVALAKAGKRVLLVDSDPQANLTSYLGVQPGSESFPSLRTLDEIYLAKRPLDKAALREFITPTSSGVDLIGSSKDLSGVEYYLFNRTDKELALARFFAAIRADYDFIFIDTPPSLNLLTLNALCASDRILIPVQPEFFSLEGIVKIRSAIEDVRSRWNPRLEILGVLATQVSPRRKLTGEVLEILKAELGPLFFSAVIHDSAAVSESSGHAQSVMDYDRGSKGSREYMAVAAEVLMRTSPALAEAGLSVSVQENTYEQPTRA
jgi:chromosome partitioning protein